MHDSSQALAWLNFAVLFLTLLCVALYLRETNKIRITGEMQLEAQIAPALTLVREGDSLFVHNVGHGVALNVRAVRTKADSPGWDAAANFGVDWLRGLPVMVSDRVDTGQLVSTVGTLRGEHLQLLYESLSGRLYCSILTFFGDGTPERVDFFSRRAR